MIANDPELEYLMIEVRMVWIHQQGAAEKTNRPMQPKANQAVD
jgi:hypothetical protein